MKQFLPVFFLLFSASAASAQPLTAKSFYKKGIEQRDKGLFLDAMGSFKRAIVLNKNFDSAYLEAGSIYARTTRPDSAVWFFKKAISINTKFTTAYIALGNFYRDVQPTNFDSALSCYMAAIRLDSSNKVTYYSIAWCYNAKSEYEKAIPFAVKALNIDNDYKPAYSELGHAYRRTGKFKEGIEQFKKNLSVSVVDLALLYSGFCYLELKDKESALQQYEALKKVNEKMAESLKKRIDATQ